LTSPNMFVWHARCFYLRFRTAEMFGSVEPRSRRWPGELIAILGGSAPAVAPMAVFLLLGIPLLPQHRWSPSRSRCIHGRHCVFRLWFMHRAVRLHRGPYAAYRGQAAFSGFLFHLSHCLGPISSLLFWWPLVGEASGARGGLCCLIALGG